ncbi:8-methylmenaquinol:fumarate reductase flavoprotein subunit [Wolinella succinogenes]|uniref:8-methylmenaquinol:fumarate reductase flavoprotein subunit n=1 Tax=Wolinella succinogenes (strain ATCC 29543 / DSM 1740 / CCUG 13145 / JCM 31913 / LMG 7466 / NCTC 11488 / FDC 602W) TaxID=273121 RepID=MFRA_WOLSU|nr:8-methylmenaquinol:fumarate reductase flavoprotein subunit [Wolinella succinogenes]Q7M827.1 RecName: Full=8-methylmenaquinol:fumarate reductase flavoprotein subunit; Short=MFR flavoprotein subunit; Flags: Precursor [Wolinella succinogenes DSM 1740]HCZ18419.1 FAD-binding protein [Helicobacter sp.]NLU34708.1 FAD-dependent oxidoreductase [Wolinella succinogenes]CAE10929.1 SUCCINATE DEHYDROGENASE FLAVOPROTEIN SUBUNIT [Wolinella succinogenes]VEG81088.1 Fumarate reductase flavoprotein subunit [Wo
MSEQFTRREFLQSACITMGALAVSTSGVDRAFASSSLPINTSGIPSCDVLIIGSGAAGLRAAVAARKKDPSLNVIVVSKVMPTRSATTMAEGGINGVIDFSEGDSFALHAYDTVKGGDFLVDQDTAMKFAEHAGEAIHELDYIGMPFSRDKNGKVDKRYAGGASKIRCNFSADKTGHILTHTCLDDALKNGVKFLMDHQLLDIGVDNGRCEGVVLRDIRTGTIAPVRAKSVVLATGGYTRVFWNRTSTPYIATGDGAASAMRAGVAFKDPEMLQFHPTGVCHGGVLITEAARGEGGILLNNQGERFMKNYAKKMELAPRDIVSRSIETEIREGRAFGKGMEAYVLLDVTHLGKEKIMRNLPQIRHIGLLFENMDLVEKPIAIRPTAHYSMGGIDVMGLESMSTAIPGLFAAGEAACVSIHGANRLGGNSLCDTVVTGKIAGTNAASFASSAGFGSGTHLHDLTLKWMSRFKEVANGKGEVNEMYAIREELGAVNWDNMGVFRTESRLVALEDKHNELQARYDALRIPNTNPVFNTAFTEYVELGNILLASRAARMGAEARKESRGSHYREDYIKRDDANFLKHSMVTMDSNGKLHLGWKDVVVTQFKIEERKY